MRSTLTFLLVVLLSFCLVANAFGGSNMMDYGDDDQDDDQDDDMMIMNTNNNNLRTTARLERGMNLLNRRRSNKLDLNEMALERDNCAPDDRTCLDVASARFPRAASAVRSALRSRVASGSGAPTLRSSNLSRRPLTTSSSVAGSRLMSANILASGNVNFMRATENEQDEQQDDQQEGDDDDQEGDEQEPTQEEKLKCKNLSILECIMTCRHTRNLAKAMRAVEKTNFETSSYANAVEGQQSQVWWKNLISKLSDVNAAQSQGGITFFAPNNKAMKYFSKIVKKMFPVPFTSKIAAALLSYHLVTGFTNSSSVAYGNGLTSSMIKSELKKTLFPSVMLNTALTCPGFVNLGANVPQIISVSKCEKTNQLEVNFGVHNAPLFTARIIVSDVPTKNGIIHLIDRVLVMPFSTLSVLEMTGKSSFLATLSSSNLLPMIQSMPFITFLVPPTAHVDSFNQALVDYTSSASATPSSILSLWKSHIITSSPALLQRLESGMELRTAGEYALSFRTEFDNVTKKQVYFIGGAQVLNCAITRNGVMLFIDRILEIPGVPQISAINAKHVNDVSCSQL